MLRTGIEDPATGRVIPTVHDDPLWVLVVTDVEHRSHGPGGEIGRADMIVLVEAVTRRWLSAQTLGAPGSDGPGT